MWNKPRRNLLSRRCHECGNPFTMTAKEVGELRKANRELPNLCKQCRKLEVIDKRLKKLVQLFGLFKTMVETLIKKEPKRANANPKSKSKRRVVGK